jgi:thymidylate synthase|tara:strand:+ start:128 stop:364 length:237 start_codon:yes stop_codon:yes gene_type:complete
MKEDRGSHDLEERIDRLTKRVKELEDISEGHRMLNGELRKEIYYWKEKSAESEKDKNLLQGYKNVIHDLSSQLRKAGK